MTGNPDNKPDGPNDQDANVSAFPEATQSAKLSDALARIRDVLRAEFPQARHIALEFDGKLVAHLDLRNKSELDLAEARLPFLGGGHLFSDPRRGNAPLHPFHHRITVSVAR